MNHLISIVHGLAFSIIQNYDPWYRRVTIGFDKDAQGFAHLVARIFASYDIRVYVFEQSPSLDLLMYASSELSCCKSVMVYQDKIDAYEKGVKCIPDISEIEDVQDEILLSSDQEEMILVTPSSLVNYYKNKHKM